MIRQKWLNTRSHFPDLTASYTDKPFHHFPVLTSDLLWGKSSFHLRGKNLKESPGVPLLKSQATLKPVASLSSPEHWQIATHVLAHLEPLSLPLLDPLTWKPVEWEEFVVGLSHWPTSPQPKTLTVSEMIPVWKKTVMVMSRIWQTLCAFLVSRSFHLLVSWRLFFWNFLVLVHGAGELWKQCFSSWSGALPPPAHLTDSPDTPVHPYLVQLISLPVCLLWVTCDWFCASQNPGKHIPNPVCSPKSVSPCLGWVAPDSVFQSTSIFQQFSLHNFFSNFFSLLFSL